MSIGNNIKLLRKSKKMTRRQLAKKAGVNYRTLENIEMNRSANPSAFIIKKIAMVLEIPVDVLLFDDISNNRVHIVIPASIFKVITRSKTQRLIRLLKETKVKELEKVSDFLLSLALEK